MAKGIKRRTNVYNGKISIVGVLMIRQANKLDSYYICVNDVKQTFIKSVYCLTFSNMLSLVLLNLPN